MLSSGNVPPGREEVVMLLFAALLFFVFAAVIANYLIRSHLKRRAYREMIREYGKEWR
jgi:hypothetical protein